MPKTSLYLYTVKCLMCCILECVNLCRASSVKQEFKLHNRYRTSPSILKNNFHCAITIFFSLAFLCVSPQLRGPFSK